MAHNKFLGIALILLGLVFLLPIVSDVEFPLEQWWPLFLVVIGFVSAFGGNWKGGLAVTAVGAALLLYELDILDIDASSLWPVALIAVGAAILIGYRRSGAGGDRQAGDDFDVTCLFSDTNQVATSDHFRGGNVSATFGSAEIDLTTAAVADGGASINANALFGRIDLRVPPGWAVDVRPFAAFGSVECKRAQPADPQARLTVTGSCLFGGIVVTS